MKNFSQRFPRLIGMFTLALGIGLAFFLRYTYQTGGSLDDRAVIVTPCLILYGVMTTIQPALFLPKGSFRQAPIMLKILNILIGIIGFGIGLYLRFVTFADWR